MFEWEKNAHLYQSYKITSRCYINEKWLFLWEWRKKNTRYALSGIAKEMFYSKKSFIVRSEKNAYVFFLFIAKTGSITSTVYTNFEFRMSHYYYRKFSPLTKFIWGIKKARIPLSDFFGSFQFASFWWPKNIPMFIENDVIRFDAMPFRWLKHLMRWL